MAVSVKIQETIIVPTPDGCSAQLYISDKQRDAADAALTLVLRVQIGQTRSDLRNLKQIQLQALNTMVDALKPLQSSLYD